jgi:hypothetical protein
LPLLPFLLVLQHQQARLFGQYLVAKYGQKAEDSEKPRTIVIEETLLHDRLWVGFRESGAAPSANSWVNPDQAHQLGKDLVAKCDELKQAVDANAAKGSITQNASGETRRTEAPPRPVFEPKSHSSREWTKEYA